VRLRTALVIAAMLWTGTVTRGQNSAVDRTPDRVDRLRQWLEAVEQHEPGAADESLLRVASWDRATLWRVWIDAGTIVSLVRDPNVQVFYAPTESEPFSAALRVQDPRSIKPRVISYGWNDVKRLQAIAKDAIERGGDDRILKRGASLHADIVMLEAGQSLTSDPSRQPRSSSIMLFLVDGQQTGLDEASVHWEMGRRLLDKVRPKTSRKLGPDPGADETVRLWYLASSAYMQAVEQLDGWHFERAVQLFPRDSEILFLAACAREMFSGPQIQNVLASMTLSRDLFNLVGNEGDELGKAERFFRQSLEQDPRRTEARIRLGRVLGRRGRHQDAIVELRRATMETKNRLLQYYGQMFLGAEAAALDLEDESRRAYERAAELYPDAQSPRLAIGALAARTGDRAGALSAIQPVLTGDDPQRSDDPWWSYYTSQARGLVGIVEALHEAVQKAPQ
jgi:tetratricopeptide (TPR) repeat protein